MRKFVASAVLILALVAVSSAGEHIGVVSKFEDGKITMNDLSALLQGGSAEEIKLSVASDVKVLKGKLNLQGGFQIDADGNYEGGKEAFAKAVKDAATKKKADDKKADDKKGAKKGGGGAFAGILGGGGVMAQVITEGEGDKAKVVEIRVFDIGNLKKKKGGN